MLKILGPNKDAAEPASHDAVAPDKSIRRALYERKLFRCDRRKWRKTIINDAWARKWEEEPITITASASVRDSSVRFPECEPRKFFTSDVSGNVCGDGLAMCATRRKCAVPAQEECPPLPLLFIQLLPASISMDIFLTLYSFVIRWLTQHSPNVWNFQLLFSSRLWSIYQDAECIFKNLEILRETVLNTLDKRLTNVSMSNLLGVISNSWAQLFEKSMNILRYAGWSWVEAACLREKGKSCECWKDWILKTGIC